MSTRSPTLPEELYVEVTNRCNSRCATCIHTFREPEQPRDMALEEVCALVDQIPHLERIVLHGVGEPLLNPDLPAIISYLKRRSDPPHVLFNSNAILLGDSMQEALLEAGLDEFRISTDAAHRGLYACIRGVDAFDQVVANVAAFARRIAETGHNTRLSLWLTSMQENVAELPALVRLAHRLGVGEVYVQRLVHHGQGLAQEQQSIFRALRAAEEELLAEAEALAERLDVRFSASGATSPRDSLMSADGHERPWSECRRPSSLMYVTANGNVLPCCLSPFTTRDYQGVILGNAFQAPLAEIWNGPRYQRFRTLLASDTPWECCDRCGVYWSL